MTFEVLESSLLNVLVAQPNYNPIIWDYFTNLYTTGCRPTELTNYQRWTNFDDDNFLLHPSKNNYDRVISKFVMTDSLIDAIAIGNATYYACLYGKALFFFEKFYEFQPVYVRTKNIDLYLFRHHYVKKLYRDGHTISEITAHMGWVNPLMAVNYIDSVIEY